MSCSCPGFNYRAICKHAAALQARINKQVQTEAGVPLNQEAS